MSSSEESIPIPMRFPAGSRVKITGLVNKPDLNGQVGVVLKPEHSQDAANGYGKGKVPIQLVSKAVSGADLLLVRPESLELASRDSAYNKSLIFVYGTLKRGYTNHVRYLSVAEISGAATLAYHAVTVSKFPLVIRPPNLLPATCGPVLMDREGDGHCIRGEVWEMDERTVAAMDILEGVRDGHYYKKRITVRSDDGRGELPQDSNPRAPLAFASASCYQRFERGWEHPTSSLAEWRCGPSHLEVDAYFYPPKDELLALDRLTDYDDNAHELYRPSPELRSEILELCQPPRQPASSQFDSDFMFFKPAKPLWPHARPPPWWLGPPPG